MERLISLAAGYLCGNFLTGELVARYRTGKHARELGSGNPGMANIGGTLGVKWAAAVLTGDIGKTVLACLLCEAWLCPGMGAVGRLYAGLGCVLGHNFPLWTGFRGGKGVAVTCTALVLAAPLWGVAACLCGLAMVLISGYLPLGAVVIPLAFLIPAFGNYGAEAGWLTAALTGVMLLRNWQGLERIVRGEEKRSRIWAGR